MSELARLAAEAADGLRRRGMTAEVYMVEAAERGIEFKEGALDGVQETALSGTGLRLLEDGRQAFAYCQGTDKEAVARLTERVRSQVRHLPADPHRGLPGPAEADAPAGFAESLWDASLFSAPLTDVVPYLKGMESEALKDKRVKKVLRMGYGESRAEVAIANTLGLSASERGTNASIGLSASAETDGEIQIGSASDSKRFFCDLDFALAGRQAAERGADLLGGKKLPTKRRSVVFDPWMAPEFLEMLAGALSADQVQRGKSLMAGRLGAPIASKLVSFIDDPRRPRGAASSLFDDEGVPTRRKAVVQDGVLRDYFYDTYTARREGKATNGSASRASFRGLPSPGSSNFYLAPGGTSRERLIADTQDGVLVLEVMGMHMADPVSGEFSVGLSGLAIENGRVTHAVKGSMLSGNALDMLHRVDAVADDLTFYGSIGSPTFRVADLTVA